MVKCFLCFRQLTYHHYLDSIFYRCNPVPSGDQQWGVTWSRKLPGAAEVVSNDGEVVSSVKGQRGLWGLSATVTPWATGPYDAVLSTVEHWSVHEMKAEVNAAKNGDAGESGCSKRTFPPPAQHR